MPQDRPKKAQRRVWTVERCYIAELLNEAAYPEVSVARTWVEPGFTTQLHSLSVYEWYIIESGSGLMHVADEEVRGVGRGDVITIAKHKSQRIENTGDTDIVFLCVCAPRFELECYKNLE